MKKSTIAAILIILAGCNIKEPETEYIISGKDTIVITAYNGYSIDVSKAHTHGYWNKTKDSAFTVFNSCCEADSVTLGKDSIFSVHYNLKQSNK